MVRKKRDVHTCMVRVRLQHIESVNYTFYYACIYFQESISCTQDNDPILFR